MADTKLQIKNDMKKLITAVTGFQTGDENFDICLSFAKSNMKYHRFLTPDSHKIERSVKGICEKFEIHSQPGKAAALREKVEEFLNQPGVATGYHRDHSKTDVHYAMLSFLLELAMSPTKAQFQRKVKDTPVEEVVDSFDWGSYLLDEEDRNFVSYASSESDEEESLSISDPTSSEVEEEVVQDGDPDIDRSQDQLELSRDTGGESQRSYPELAESRDDESSQLERRLVVGYWEGKSLRESSVGDHRTSNLIQDWNFYKNQLNEPVVATVVVTETQVIRETLWMLSGITTLYIFNHSGQEFSLNPHIYVSHLTTETLKCYLRPLIRNGNQVQTLASFVSDIVSQTCTGPPGYHGGCPQTYQAFSSCVFDFLSDMRDVLVSLEKEVISQNKLMTLETLSKRLRPWQDKLQAVHGVYLSGVARPSHQLHAANNCVKATALLDTLHEAVFESDLLVGTDDHGVAMLMLNFLISTSRPLLNIASDWVNYGRLIDPQAEFVLHRNLEVRSLDETFWEKAFVSNLESDDLMTSDKKTTLNSTSTPSDRSHGDCSMSYPKFLQSILGEVITTGKSMEMLENLDRMSEALEKGVERFEKPLSLFDHLVKQVTARLNPDLTSNDEQVSDPDPPQRDKSVGLVEKQLQQPGARDTLLQLQFRSLFSDTKPHKQSPQSQSRPKRRTQDFHLSELRVEQMSQALRVCQSCLRPYVLTRYSTVCSRLLHILRTEHKLEQCIQSMQRYFLMEAGEVMYDFYASVFLRIDRQEPWKEEDLLEMFLHEAVDLSNPGDSVLLSVSLVPVSRESAQHAISATDCIRLKYNVPWPVNTVIASGCQDRYNDIFNFLMQIKRAKFSLEQLRFEDLSDSEQLSDLANSRDPHPDPLPPTQRVHRFQLLRFRLLYFVNSLHTYVMTRILHSTGLELSHDLPAAADLEEVIRVHREYVERIHDRCLLHPRLAMVKGAVGQVLGLALTCAAQWRKGGALLSGDFVLELEQELSRCIHFLSSFLNNVIKRGSFPHLESLAFALSSLHQGS